MRLSVPWPVLLLLVALPSAVAQAHDAPAPAAFAEALPEALDDPGAADDVAAPVAPAGPASLPSGGGAGTGLAFEANCIGFVGDAGPADPLRDALCPDDAYQPALVLVEQHLAGEPPATRRQLPDLAAAEAPAESPPEAAGPAPMVLEAPGAGETLPEREAAPAGPLPLRPAREPAPVPPSAARDAADAGAGRIAATALATAALAAPLYFLLRAALSAILGRGKAGEGSPVSPVKQRILDLVRDHPGIHHSELVRRVGKGNGSVEYHALRMLRSNELVRFQAPGCTCYFLPGAVAPSRMPAHASMRTPSAQGLVALAARHPGLSLSELARRMGLATSNVHYHLKRLAAAELLLVERAGPAVRVRPTALGTAWAGAARGLDDGAPPA